MFLCIFAQHSTQCKYLIFFIIEHLYTPKLPLVSKMGHCKLRKLTWKSVSEVFLVKYKTSLPHAGALFHVFEPPCFMPQPFIVENSKDAQK